MLGIETSERINQNHYPAQFILRRQHIIGDGNCPFRAISFVLEYDGQNQQGAYNERNPQRH
jgi:hypothetical protein